MNITEYIEKAQRTSASLTKEQKLLNAAYGLAGEIGELCDHIKKHKFQGHDLDRDYIGKELGDILWYCVEGLVGLEKKFPVLNVKYDDVSIDEALYMHTYSGDVTFNVLFDKPQFIYINICEITTIIFRFASLFDYTPGQIMQINIDKLEDRYPGGVFDADRSRNRE